jgi:hypothetical protein
MALPPLALMQGKQLPRLAIFEVVVSHRARSSSRLTEISLCFDYIDAEVRGGLSIRPRWPGQGESEDWLFIVLQVLRMSCLYGVRPVCASEVTSKDTWAFGGAEGGGEGFEFSNILTPV